ncbi:hypothetical protein K7711_10015 [Nocardia sp. CA2R105]|uniref:hypothetical protein n=1 Tax=Nocardia coffeae TaxID=2873381 RepID=UPI001CA64670|nr:hypothetical protein [Nocardia coffeae]MBY8856811.1 hypothetical protein [Nocardia coffeae]
MGRAHTVDQRHSCHGDGDRSGSARTVASCGEAIAAATYAATDVAHPERLGVFHVGAVGTR